jgi:hypothetical protein
METFLSTQDIGAELAKIKPLALRLMSDGFIYTYTPLIWGLLNRAYEITESAIWALDNDRPLTAAAMLRALYETLAFTHYACDQMGSASSQQEFEERIQKLLLGSKAPGAAFASPNILTCLDKATKMFPELRKSYDALSEMVHPNSASHFYSGKTDGPEDERGVQFGLPFYEFKSDDKKNITNQVGECCHHIQTLCETMIVNLQRNKTK